jgi:hypothetical protein
MHFRAYAKAKIIAFFWCGMIAIETGRTTKLFGQDMSGVSEDHELLRGPPRQHN